jgi:DNA polymerase-3 subunit gamma/tau
VNHLAKIAEKEGIEIGTDALHIIAEKADGGLRDALSIFDQVVGFSGNTVTYQDVISNLNILDYDYYFKMTDAFLRGDKPEVIILFNQILSNGFDGHNFINGLANHFRNLMFCTSERTVALLAVGDQVKAKYLSQSKECDLRFMLNAMNMLSEVDSKYKESKNQRLLVEITLLKLCSFSEKFNEKKNDNSEVAKPAIEQPIAAHASEVASLASTKTTLAPEPKSETPAPTPPSEQKVTASIAQDSERVGAPAEIKPIETTEVKKESLDNLNTDTAKETLSAAKSEKKPDENISKEPKPEIQKVKEPKEKLRGYSSKLSGLKSRGLPSLSEIGEEKKSKPRFENNADQIENGNDSSDFDKLPANEFTMGQLWKAWEKYAQIIKDRDQQSYFATLSKHNPILKDNFQIEFLVDNHVQFDDVERDKANLLEVLREELKNWKVQLKVVVDEEEGDDGNSLYDPYSKFEAMIKENPALAHLKEKLDLDIDYDG